MKTMRLLRRCLPALALTLTNCFPFPHHQQESPTIWGVATNDGIPASNVSVRLVINPDKTVIGCPSTAKATRTDDAGRFSFPSTNYFSAFFVMGDRYDTWRICFDKPDGQQAIWDNGAFWGGPPALDVKCDLKTNPDPKAQICSATARR